MKLTPTQLRNIIREEVKRVTSGKKNLSEAMTRITQEEISAWQEGNWGFVSESEQYSSEQYSDEEMRDELVAACIGILQDPTTSLKKVKEAYNLLAKDPLGEPQPGLSDLIKQRFSVK